MPINRTLKEALQEANPPVSEFTASDIWVARRINRLAQLMNGDRQAAALAILADYLGKTVDGSHSIKVFDMGD